MTLCPFHYSNLKPREFKALQDLRNIHDIIIIIIKPAEKAVPLYIWRKDLYFQAGKSHLKNQIFYSSRHSAKTFHNKSIVRKTIVSIVRVKKFYLFCVHIFDSNVGQPIFYMLPKLQ